MKNTPTFDEINNLFDNGDPDEVWSKAVEIIRRINPAFDFCLDRTVLDDVVRLFHGEYPGYYAIGTLYHDLRHTLDVFLCAVRLMYGVHVSGTRLTDKEMTLIMMGALLHDVGYAPRGNEEPGTGAQYTQNHVDRGIEFMQRYIVDRDLSPELEAPLRCIILGTNPGLPLASIPFADERIRLLAQIVGAADLTGQMADRTYLEKLLFLYLEFEEANFGSYRNVQDLLRKTRSFYDVTQRRLDGDLGGIYAKLSSYFKDWFGTENNYYVESIEKNIDYLSKITSLNEAKYLSMLKRGGIVDRTGAFIVPEDIT